MKKLYGIEVWISDRKQETNAWWADVYVSYPYKKIDGQVFWLGGSPSLVFNLFESRIERDNAVRRLRTQIKKGWLDNSSYKYQNNIRKKTFIVGNTNCGGTQ